MVYIVFTSVGRLVVHRDAQPRVVCFFIADDPVALGHENNFPARDVVHLEGLAKKPFGLSIGIDVRRVPGIDATVYLMPSAQEVPPEWRC